MKKVALWIVTAFTAVNLLIAVAVNVSAATCTSTDGKSTCSGECCIAGPTGCVAGACKDLIPQ